MKPHFGQLYSKGICLMIRNVRSGDSLCRRLDETSIFGIRQTCMMLASLVCAVALSALSGDRLLLVETLSCADWTQLANDYMSMGQDRAVAGLIERSNRVRETGETINFNTRTCLMARLIFEPKGKEPLRAPMLGGLPLPRHSMPLSDWPQYPFVKVGDMPFLLSESYILGGAAEACKDYLAYCMKNGKFRTQLYSVPTTDEAKVALKKLFSEDRWKNIKWNYTSANESYEIHPGMVMEYLSKQTAPGDF